MIAVVIPCYKVKDKLLKVVNDIGPEVDVIYAVDDCCPQDSVSVLNEVVSIPNSRVKILRNSVNLGVGGAVKLGYVQAVMDGAAIVVKIDGDGQMDTSLIPKFINPIQSGLADYTKGNRFYDVESFSSMPLVRLIGNAGLSLVNKFSHGYWDIVDPTNGYTAISREALKALSLDKIDNRYFFESDMLFRLNISRAVVQDIVIKSIYADEKSNLSSLKSLFQFPFKLLKRFIKRVLYSYFVRDFNAASIALIFGILFLLFGVFFGGWRWYSSFTSGVSASPGTVMLASLPTMLGVQLILFFFQYDISMIPKAPLARRS